MTEITPDDNALGFPGEQQSGGEAGGGGANGKDKSEPRIKLVPFEAIRLDADPPYLVKGLVPREGLTVVWGPPKSGKSFWAFDLAMSVALSRDYRGRRVQAGPVVYVACEGAAGFRARVEAYRQRHLAEEITPVPFYLVPVALDLIADGTEFATAIRRTLGEQNPALIVLDTLNRSLAGSENDPADMGAYIKAADAIREAFGCAIMVVHHCGTEGSRPRGHTSLTGAADAQLAVKRNTDGVITTTVEWMKDGPEGDTLHSRLEIVTVGQDSDRDDIVSCVIMPIDSASGTQQKPLTGYAKTAYEALVEVVDRKQRSATENKRENTGERNFMSPNGTSAHVPVGLWRKEFYARCIDGGDMKRDTLKKRFQRAAETLQAAGKVGFRNDQAWVFWDAGTCGT